ncbi:hypothetical protein BYT27DRAFT_7209381 [Phlegmacium glaucopus]|nr:hypothetical protein BYT27DRAFT_7209381 [Phlegmacium glaucopus]
MTVMLDSAVNKGPFTMALWHCPVLSSADKQTPNLLMDYKLHVPLGTIKCLISALSIAMPEFNVYISSYGPRLLHLKKMKKVVAELAVLTASSKLLSYSLITVYNAHISYRPSVPMLKANGNNWVMFYVHFRGAVKARGFWSHFNGPSSVPVLSTKPTAAEIAVKGQYTSVVVSVTEVQWTNT